jgi:hypothetical protein
MTQSARRIVFVFVCLVAVGISAYYAIFARRTPPAFSATTQQATANAFDSLPPGQRGIFFRSTVPDSTFGKVAFVPADRPEGPWSLTSLSCDRVYFQGGRGVCEFIDTTLVPPYAMFVFDERFRAGSRQPLTGVPNRARISPDGRRAAITVFETGHSYAEGGFSTRTTIVDTTSGAIVGDLEKFAVTRDGAPFKAVDFNFWGVTFAADGNHFYATLRTAGINYLIEGNVDAQTARVIHTGVECPSLSPDGGRLAFKKRTIGSLTVFWKVAVLDLKTMAETVLEWETRSVDDQVDWLDDQHVVYHLPKSGGADIWSLRTDHADAPRLFITGGYSPSVVR